MKPLRVLPVLALVLVVCIAARGQSVVPEIALAASLDAGTVSTRFPVAAGSYDCGAIESGRVVGGRLAAEIALPSFPVRGLGVSTSVGLTLRSENLVAQLTPITFYDFDLHAAAEAAHEARYAALDGSVHAELLATFDLGGVLRIGAGPWGAYRLTTRAGQTDVITDGSYRFSGGAVARDVTDGAVLTATALSGGIVASVDYLGAVRSGWSIAPRLQFRTSVVSEREEYSWRTTTLGVGVRILYRRSEEEHDHVEPPTHVDPPVGEAAPVPSDTLAAPLSAVIDPLPAPLVATLRLRGVDSAGTELPEAVVGMRETRWREIMPLDTFMPLDGRGDLVGAERLVAAGAATFTPDSLFGGGPAGYAAHLLDIIGYRLRAMPGSGVTLGVAQGDPDRAAVDIRSYLVDVWKIDPGRVGVERTRRGASARRGITVAAKPASLLAPVVAERIEREVEPPQIALRPVFSSGSGIAQWEITLEHGSRLLSRVTSADDRRRALRWRIAHDDTLPAPLVATLSVTDSAGSSVIVSDSTTLALRRSVRSVEHRFSQDGRREDLAIRLLDGGAREGLDAHDSVMLGDLLAAIRNSARVVLFPLDGSEASRALAACAQRLLRAGAPSYRARIDEGAARADGLPSSATDIEVGAVAGLRIVIEHPMHGSDGSAR